MPAFNRQHATEVPNGSPRKPKASLRTRRAFSISTTGKPVSTRWAVIATGSPASAARLTCQKAAQIDSMIAFWAHLPTNHEERLLRVEPADCGWWYLCPADGPATIACFVTDPATSRNLRPDVPARWNDLFGATELHRQLADDPSAAAVHVALTGLAALPKRMGSRWIAVGDAAAKLDPLGSSGTATALDSGHGPPTPSPKHSEVTPPASTSTVAGAPDLSQSSARHAVRNMNMRPANRTTTSGHAESSWQPDEANVLASTRSATTIRESFLRK